jgi:hypothetical protein
MSFSRLQKILSMLFLLLLNSSMYSLLCLCFKFLQKKKKCFFQIQFYVGELFIALDVCCVSRIFKVCDTFAIFPTINTRSVGEIYNIVPVLFFHHFWLNLALW